MTTRRSFFACMLGLPGAAMAAPAEPAVNLAAWPKMIREEMAALRLEERRRKAIELSDLPRPFALDDGGWIFFPL